MIKCVIIDWDGTLIDSMETVFKIYSVHSGKPLEYIRKNFDPDWRNFIAKENLPEMSYDKWQQLLDRFGTKIFQGAAEFLRKLKKDYVLCLATSTTIITVNADLKRYGLSGIFDVFVTSEDVRKLKPDPECLKVALKKLNAEKEECVFVGDADADATAAKAIGMKFIGVGWGYQPPERVRRVNNDRIVNSFEELYNTIKEL